MAFIKQKSPYIVSLGFVFLFSVFYFELYNADITIPFWWGGDTSFTGSYVQKMIESGSIFYSDRLGAPFHGTHYDFLLFDSFHILILRAISFFCSSWGAVINIYFLLTFYVVSLTAVFVLRRMGFSDWSCVLGAIVYAITPYHFYRGTWHLFLSAYYMVPIAIWICFLLSQNKLYPLLRQRKFCALFVFGLFVIGTTGVYYAYFFCFFALISILYNIFNNRRIEKGIIKSSVFCISITLISGIINILPNLYYFLNNGGNAVTTRYISEVELFGLKLAPVLLPVTHHRIPVFSYIRQKYDSNVIVSEVGAGTLGTLCTLGFFVLLICLLKENNEKLKYFSVLTVLAVLLATVGGLSSVVALVFPFIRAYNRISIFICFFSIVVVCTVFDHVIKVICKRLDNRYARFSSVVLCAAIAFFAVFDQTTNAYVPDHQNNKESYDEYASFIADIEMNVPAGSMVFQLPYMVFPEHGTLNNMIDYSHISAYLVSRELKWSYGAMKGRDEDLWIRETSQKPTEELVEILSTVGFCGIYIDREGYLPDELAGLEEELKALTNEAAAESPDGRYAFFSLEQYVQNNLSDYSSEQLQQKRYEYLHPIQMNWQDGFHGQEKFPDGDTVWRWCGQRGVLDVFNPGDQAYTVNLSGYLVAFEDSVITVSINGTVERFPAKPEGVFFELEFIASPGHTFLVFSTDGQQMPSGADPRSLYFQLVDENYEFNSIQ